MDEAELFKFMEDCYYQYKEGTLPQEHYDKLMSISPDWIEHVESELGINKEDDISEQKLIEEIKESAGWYLTKEIVNPSPKLQMIAIKRNFNIIRDMKNPCKEVLEYINNLSEIDKLDLLSWSTNIKFITNPSKKLQMRAIQSGEPHWVIPHIENPCKKVLKYIKRYDEINESTDTQLKSVIDDGLNLNYVCHYEYWEQGDDFKINEEVELTAVKQNIKAVKYCNMYTMGKETLDYINSSESLQIKAVKTDEYLISKIEKPSEKVQLAAVKNAYDPEMIVFDFIDEDILSPKLQKKYF